MKLSQRASLVLLAVLLGAGAARAALFDDEEARRRIEATNQRIVQMQRQLEDRLALLEQQAKSGGLADLGTQLQLLQGDLAKLRGQIEVITYELEQSQKRQRDLYVDLDSRLRKIEASPALTAPPANTGAPDAGTPAGPRLAELGHAAATGRVAGRRVRHARRCRHRATGSQCDRRRHRAARVRRRARSVQARRLPGCNRRLLRIREELSAQSARVVGAILDRQRAVRAPRLSSVDRHAASIAEGLPRQQQGAGRVAQHRIRAVRHG